MELLLSSEHFPYCGRQTSPDFPHSSTCFLESHRWIAFLLIGRERIIKAVKNMAYCRPVTRAWWPTLARSRQEWLDSASRET
jgi:hypothetical protein